MIMARRSKASSDDRTPVAKAVTAVFNPVGMVKVHVVTPSGNDYDVKPREPFKIKADDVDWFFTSWHWSFRQHLCRAEDYKPVAGYKDNTVIGTKAKKPVVLVQQDSSTFEQEPGPTPEPEAKQEPEPEAKLEPEPDEGQDPEKE